MRKKLIITGAIVLFVAIVLGAWYALKGGSFGGAVLPESYIYSAQDANFVSISYEGGTDEIISDAAHGLLVGDAIRFNTASAAFGGADAPGWNKATRYFVITASTSTAFEVSTTQGGSALNIAAAASAGGGEFAYELVEGRAFENPYTQGNTFVYSVCGDSTASATIQFVGSLEVEEPDFYAAKSNTNRYDALDVYDLQSGSSIDGDTGVEQDESADCRLFEVLAKGIRWISAITAGFLEGSIDIQLQITN